METRIETINRLVDEVAGVITEAEARELILKKHNDLVAEQLDRYLNYEQRFLFDAFYNLWDKYAISLERIEEEANSSLSELNNYFSILNYKSKSNGLDIN